MSIRVRAALIGLGVSSLCPLSALGAYLCADKDSVYVLGLILFALAYVFSLPGFFVGWILVHGFRVESTVAAVSAVFVSNVVVYSLIAFAVIGQRRRQLA